MNINRIFERNNCLLLRALFCLASVCAIFNLVSTTQTAQAETDKHFLWSIRTQKNTVYVLGSVHFLRQDAYPLAEVIEKAYSDSQKIVFEADIDSGNAPELQAKMMGLGLYLDGQTLQQNVSEQTYKVLKEKVAAVGLPISQLDRFRPWFAALMLTVMELQKMQFDPSYGVDAYFFRKAKEDEKQRIFLEPVEFQIDLFAKMGPREQESFLKQTMEDLGVIESMVSDMVNSWQIGDVDTLGSILNMSFSKHPDMYDRIMVQRNINWVSRIEGLLNQDGNVLVIVGAGHLVGDQNLLQLLRKRGYKMEQK
ncbi:MAG: TraB/GumN family protein [Deltaproteobacteria bacterium]|nr:TraB/GumN family protein [Deltaproteobacteria bacterium]